MQPAQAHTRNTRTISPAYDECIGFACNQFAVHTVFANFMAGHDRANPNGATHSSVADANAPHQLSEMAGPCPVGQRV